MSLSHAAVLAFGATTLVTLGCGGPGLPPAGPGPGEVEIGYDTRPAKDVTGAMSSLSGDHLSESSFANLEELLRGRVAGLQIVKGAGGHAVLRIRGPNSISSEPEPLIIVDGVQISSSGLTTALAGLTRDDIRQVDVLKDVSSTAIYGMRGAGGVILITTRR